MCAQPSIICSKILEPIIHCKKSCHNYFYHPVTNLKVEGKKDDSEELQVRPVDLGCLSGVSCYVVVSVVMVVCGRVYVRLVVQL